ncbi:hypothetical protein BJX62DRAFT_195336 [Aspergillus germanicus]
MGLERRHRRGVGVPSVGRIGENKQWSLKLLLTPPIPSLQLPNKRRDAGRNSTTLAGGGIGFSWLSGVLSCSAVAGHCQPLM